MLKMCLINETNKKSLQLKKKKNSSACEIVFIILNSPIMHWRRKWQPTPYFCLENPRDRGAWWAAIYGVAQSRTWLKRLSSSSNRLCSHSTKWVNICNLCIHLLGRNRQTRFVIQTSSVIVRTDQANTIHNKILFCSYSQEIKGCLLFGRKAITNLYSIFKKQRHHLPTKFYIIKLWFFH